MADETVLEGGPGEEKPVTQPTFGEKVTVGNQEFVVDEKFAKAYQDQQKAFREQMEAQQKQLQQLTVSVGQLQQPAQPRQQLDAPADPFEQLGELLFSDPAAAMRQQAELMKAEVKKQQDALRMEYQRDKGMDSFWGKFWKKHKDLKRDQDETIALTVGDMISKNIAGLSEDQISEKIADGVREKLKGYMERFGGSAPQTPFVEQGGGQFAPKTPQEQPKVSSLSDALKQRREARRKAAGKTGTGGT